MKTMRKASFLCAVCLSITYCPISLSAAASDDVAAQIKAASGEKYSVNTKSLGYTAKGYKDEKELREKAMTYSCSSTSDGNVLVEENRCIYAGGRATGKAIIFDKNGNQLTWADLGDVSDEVYYSEDSGILTVTRGFLVKCDSDVNAEYANITDKELLKYTTGTFMVNHVAAVLEDISEKKAEPNEFADDLGGSLHRVSLINEKGEKILTLAEPMELRSHSFGGMNEYYHGYNYSMDFGYYADGLLPFYCDRQLGATLNDLILNTEADKNGETDKSNMFYSDIRSNKYAFSEHEAGYADLTGTIIIPQKFDEVSSFCEGLAWVGITDSETNQTKYGFIDKTGNYVIEPQFEGAGSFSEGFAPVKHDGKWGYIDKEGTFVIEPRYSEWEEYGTSGYKHHFGAGSFSNGFARVAVKEGDEPAKWGFINSKDETILPLEYDDAFGSDGTYFTVSKKQGDDVKYGVIDKDGNTVLPFIFEDVTSPVDGMVYAFYNRELYNFVISRKEPNNEKTENTIYELRYKPNSSDNILTARFDKSNGAYNLDLLAEKWYSHVYCPELAHVLSVIASGAYNENNTKFNLEQLGFNDYKTINYFDTKDEEYKRDSVAFTIAKKKLSNGDTLVLIPMRGSFGGFDTLLYDQSDWRSNFRIDRLGDEVINHGFLAAASYVFENLKAEMGGVLPTSGVKYMITGHSRAAGVGNLLATVMIDSGVPQENIFDYNFACPV